MSIKSHVKESLSIHVSLSCSIVASDKFSTPLISGILIVSNVFLMFFSSPLSLDKRCLVSERAEKIRKGKFKMDKLWAEFQLKPHSEIQTH